MPLFVTVTPGTTVNSNTTLDAATLNLLGTPSVDVTGTVDGGSLSIASGSVPLNGLAPQSTNTLVGNASGSTNSPTALTSSDLLFSSGSVNIASNAITNAKIAARAVTADKLFAVDGSAGPKLLGRYTASSGDAQSLTIGSNLSVSGAGELNTLRPKFVFNNVADAYSYTNVPTIRSNGVELSPLTTSITPQLSTSKVLVQFSISCECNDYRTAFILERVVAGSPTELGVPTTPGSRMYGIKMIPFDGNNDVTQSIVTISYLDTPGSTSQVSYRLRIYTADSGGFFLNRTITDSNSSSCSRTTSQVILQEILPYT